MNPWTRRQSLAALVGGPFAALAGCGNSDRIVTATGEAFGTRISVTLETPQGSEATSLLELAFEEIARLEAVFALHQPDSALRRLNDSGHLDEAPAELIEVLELAGKVHDLTKGTFDPTVQPLWELYESHFAIRPDDEQGPDEDQLAATRRLVGWEKVRIDGDRVSLAEPGMKLTLNGVAPGYASDAVAELLRARDVEHALVDCGEFRAIGPHPSGDSWSVAIRGDGIDGSETKVGEVELDGNAVATSAGYATAFDREQRFHHLFHPGNSDFAPARDIVSVIAPEAGIADALATAGAVMDWQEFTDQIAAEPGVTARRFLGDRSA